MADNTTIIDDYPAPVMVAVGDTVSGTIAPYEDTDVFMFDLQAGHSYSFSGTQHYLSGKDGQYSYLYVERLDDATGNWVWVLPTSNGTYTVTPEADGRYRATMKAGFAPYVVQSYTFKVTDLATDDYPTQASAPNAADGSVLKGMIQSAGDVDGFKVSIAAGQTLALRVSGLAQYNFGALTADQIVLGVDGVPAGYQVHNVQGDIDFVSVTATQAGTIDLSVSAAIKGGYQLVIFNVTGDHTAPVLVSGQDAKLGLSDALHLRFSEPVGQAQGMAGSPALTLLDASGKAVTGFGAHWSGDGPWQGSELVITSGTTWQPGQDYTLLFGDATFVDMAGNSATLSAVHFSTPAVTNTSSAGDDVFRASHQGASINGGTGFDTVFYDGTADGLTVRAQEDGNFTVAAAGAQTDTLAGIERVLFSGQKDAIALDVGADGIGGEVYRLYQAALNRTPDQAGLGYWMAAMEHGMGLRDVANAFLESKEFNQLWGFQRPEVFVNQLYRNVLHRDADTAGLDYWTDQFNHDLSRSDALIAFSQSAENQAAVAQIIGNGFTYTPYSA